MRRHKHKLLIGLLLLVSMVFVAPLKPVFAAEDSGSVGIEGRISTAPPTTPATISIPRDGQSFSAVPITVSGICPNGLLVKIFKNNVFGGSVQCTNGSFSLQIDLFSGQNELVARVYDALDQAGPDSNKVNVTFNNSIPATGPRITLTSNFAKRGANPKETLTWPIILSGGRGPYAISVDWGDGKAPDLISQSFPGTFDIKHVYDNPGVYNIIIKGTDADGGTAFLQLVGVANGALSQTNSDKNTSGSGQTITKIVWAPMLITLPFIMTTFWLGKKYELKAIKKKVAKGIRPF